MPASFKSFRSTRRRLEPRLSGLVPLAILPACALLLAGCEEPPACTTDPVTGETTCDATIPWGGGAWFLYGVNLPWYNYGTDFGTGGWGRLADWNAVDTQLDAVSADQAHVVRWFLFGDGRYAPEFAADGTVTGLDAYTLDDLDQALELAELHNLYLIPALLDFYAWEEASWVNGVQLGGHAALVTDPVVRQSYLDHALRPVLEHVAASPFRDRLLAWDVVNEPEWNMAELGGGAELETDDVRAFVDLCVQYIRTYGGGAYATLGSASAEYVETWTGLDLDFYQVHYYPWMDGGGAPGSGLPAVDALGLDAPCVVGEFPTDVLSYGTQDTTPYSARWYLDLVLERGYAGAIPWSYQSGDSATDWASFQPVFTTWATEHADIVGPR